MASAWNLFVKKTYHEGKKTNPNYSFKQALKDASASKYKMKTKQTNTNNTTQTNKKIKHTKHTKHTNTTNHK